MWYFKVVYSKSMLARGNRHSPLEADEPHAMASEQVERLRADLAGAERALQRAVDEKEQQFAAFQAAEAAVQQLEEQLRQQEQAFRIEQEQA